MEYKNIIVENKDNIGTLTINRPKALNALNVDTLNEIIQGVKSSRPTIRLTSLL